MAKSLTPRFGLQRWTEDTDTQDRPEFDSANAQLETLAAGFSSGTTAARPAASAALARFFYYDEELDELSVCVDTTGAGAWAWVGPLALEADITAAVATHESAADPHPDYLTPAEGNAAYVAQTLVDAKGDLLAATAADTLARLAVGADGTVLTADAAAAAGVKWAAAGGGGDVTVIAETVLAATATSIVFSAIPATYRHLLVVFNARGTAAVPISQLTLRLNGDTTATYYDQRLRAQNGTVSAAAQAAATSAGLGWLPAASAPAGQSGSVELRIPNYAGTTFSKAMLSTVAFRHGVAAADLFSESNTAFWDGTAAVNEITLISVTGSFAIGSTATLYGIATA